MPHACPYLQNGLLPPDINAPSFVCPKRGCSRTLSLKLCGSGKKQGRFMLQCFNDHADNDAMFYFFGPNDAPAPAIATCLLQQVAQRPQAQRSSNKKSAEVCPATNCGKGGIHRSCDNKMCRTHCLDRGGCRANSHRPNTQPRHAAQPPLLLPARGQLPHQPRRVPPPPILLPALDEARQYAAMLPRLLKRLEDDEQQAQEAKAAAMSRIMSPSPSPERSLIQEWHDMELAIELSLSPPSPPPQTISRAPLSSSRPLHIASSSSSSSRTRPTSAPSTHPTSASSSSSSRSRPPASLALDRQVFAIEQCAVLVYWSDAGPAELQVLQNCPGWPSNWPHLRLSDVPHLLTTATHPHLEPKYQCFSPHYHSWMTIPTNYVHTLSTNSPLFVRRCGVVGSDEDQHLPCIPRQKKRPREVVVIDSSDDEGEGQVKIKQEPVTPPRKKAHVLVSLSPPTTTTIPPSVLPPLLPSPHFLHPTCPLCLLTKGNWWCEDIYKTST
ncbi:hypothetical protein C8R46DRAFT_1235274 [Mycena filopes]|nr:hypothetical protein C8R46DRAFT_1235274 [Mycena filopes]